MSEMLKTSHEGDELVLRYLENPRAELKDAILLQYAPMVERIARRFSGIEQQEDLVQVGYIGLLNALTKYDPAAGVRFNTYATHLVAGEIKHYLRDRSQTIRQPAWLQELRHKVNKAASLLTSQHGRPATHEEVAAHLGITRQAVEEVYATQELLKVASLDSTLPGDDETNSEVDNLDSADFCVEQLSVEDRVVLERAIQQLRDLEREVLVLFHFDSLNQTEIAGKLGISCNYVSHILRQSLAKLRRILTQEEASDRVLRDQAKTLDDQVLDPVTGVYDEAYFIARVNEEAHRAVASGQPLAILGIDFEGIENLRAFYGEVCVRDFLADTADFLKTNTRRLDIVCRYGTHGFGILLPFTGLSGEIALQRITARFDEWLQHRRAPSGQVKAVTKLSVLGETAPDATTMLEQIQAVGAVTTPGRKSAKRKAA